MSVLQMLVEAKAKSDFDKCVADKVADKGFHIKNKTKYKTRKEAAAALCAWIGSRSKPGKFKGNKPYGKKK